MTEQRNLVYQKIGASSGIVAPIVAFVCILTAIASYPTFSWTNNALSDLGVVPGITGSLFNFGLLAQRNLGFQLRNIRFVHLPWEKLGEAKLAPPSLQPRP